MFSCSSRTGKMPCYRVRQLRFLFCFSILCVASITTVISWSWLAAAVLAMIIPFNPAEKRKGMGRTGPFPLWTLPASCTYCFCLQFTDQNLVTQSHLTVKVTGKWSLFLITTWPDKELGLYCSWREGNIFRGQLAISTTSRYEVPMIMHFVDLEKLKDGRWNLATAH